MLQADPGAPDLTRAPTNQRQADHSSSLDVLKFAGPLAQGVLDPRNFVTVVSNFVTSLLVALATS